MYTWDRQEDTALVNIRIKKDTMKYMKKRGENLHKVGKTFVLFYASMFTSRTGT